LIIANCIVENGQLFLHATTDKDNLSASSRTYYAAIEKEQGEDVGTSFQIRFVKTGNIAGNTMLTTGSHAEATKMFGEFITLVALTTKKGN
jgi:hypothetical protein